MLLMLAWMKMCVCVYFINNYMKFFCITKWICITLQGLLIDSLQCHCVKHHLEFPQTLQQTKAPYQRLKSMSIEVFKGTLESTWPFCLPTIRALNSKFIRSIFWIILGLYWYDDSLNHLHFLFTWSSGWYFLLRVNRNQSLCYHNITRVMLRTSDPSNPLA